MLDCVLRDNGACTFEHVQFGPDRWFEPTAYCPSAGHQMLLFKNSSAPGRNAVSAKRTAPAFHQGRGRIRKVLVDNEAKLQEMNEMLESHLQERTRQLRVALGNAELAKRSRDTFLASRGHEIRTPMNSVLCMVYLALKTDPGPMPREYLEMIQKSGAHLLEIVNDILDFFKIYASKLQRKSAPSICSR